MPAFDDTHAMDIIIIIPSEQFYHFIFQRSGFLW